MYSTKPVTGEIWNLNVMEFFQENTLLYNITAAIYVVVLLLLVLKLIKKIGETMLIFICVIAVRSLL